jgi:urease accessory protein
VLKVQRRTDTGTPSDVLALPYDDRKKSRLRAITEQGREVAIVLERGSQLRDGDLLAADGGEVLLVRAAPEQVSDTSSADARLLARAAYHLGNRHVPLQIELGALRYQHDHVLDAMLRELGLEVIVRTAPFEPEAGAYAHGASSGGPPHSHGGEPHTHGAGAHTQRGPVSSHADDTSRASERLDSESEPGSSPKFRRLGERGSA